MALLSREELKALAGSRNDICVSIYMPTHRQWPDHQQDPVRLKNLLKQAQDRLSEMDATASESELMLDAAHRLLDDAHFWQNQSDGLALFASRDDFRTYRLPLTFEELVVVDQRFHLKPLMPLLAGDGRFYILAISQKRVRLFEASEFNVREVDLHSIPESLEDVVGYDWEERSLQFHTGTGAAGESGRRAMFHGQGAGEEDEKAEIVKFFRVVDDGVLRLLSDRQAPMVLAAVGYLVPIYREITSHPNLLDAAVEGNPDDTDAETLHSEAWKLVSDHFAGHREQDAERFQALEGSGRASSELRTLLPASIDGRIETLFVERGAHVWGEFDRENRSMSLRDDPEPGGEDLLDLVSVETLMHGGTVHALEREEMPVDGPVAAVFRY